MDVTLVLDTSSSLDGPAFEQVKKDIQAMADRLRPTDRIRLITFASDVTDVFGLQPGTAVLPLDRISAGGTTGLYDAIAAALMVSPSSERPQLVFVVSDGLDTASYTNPRRLDALARNSSATLYLGLVPASIPPSVGLNGQLRAISVRPTVPFRQLLNEAVTVTGGVVIEAGTGDSLPDLFREVLKDFRISYLIRYTPQGVERLGWHDVHVTVPMHPDLTVRARQGYESE